MLHACIRLKNRSNYAIDIFSIPSRIITAVVFLIFVAGYICALNEYDVKIIIFSLWKGKMWLSIPVD
jgi:hypothetical protein